MAQRDIYVDLLMHNQKIKEFLFETVTLTETSSESTTTTTSEMLFSRGYTATENAGKILRVVRTSISEDAFYTCNNGAWNKIPNDSEIATQIKALIKSNIVAGSGITIEQTTDGKVKVSASVGDGLKISSDKIVVNVDAGEGIKITNDTTDTNKKVIATNIKAGQGISKEVATDKSITLKTNLAGGNGITVTNDTSTTKQTITAKINSGDKILSVDENGIAGTLSVKKREPTSTETNYREVYYLTGKDNSVLGEEIPIYKDSSLKSVELTDEDDKGKTGQFLKFTYILEDGSEKAVYLDCSTFLIESEFKGGLQVSEAGVVTIKLDSTGENYLTVSDAGLKLNGVNTAINNAVKNHTHNGVDSEQISYFDITNTPTFSEAKHYVTAKLMGSTGTILANVHACGNNPIIECFQNGSKIIIDWSVDGNGNITWNVNPAFVSSDDAYIVVYGSTGESSHTDLQEMWFGYEIDETDSGPRTAVTRIAGSEGYKKQVFGKGGLLDGNLFKYISRDASTGDEIDITSDIKDYTKYSKYKYGGLNGEDGDRDIFAVPKQQLFYKIESETDEEGNRIKIRKKMSIYPLIGFTPYHKNHNVYIGLYEATNQIKDLEGNTLTNSLLCSKAMLDDATAKARYYGGSDNTGNRAGMARTSLSISNFSNIAHNKTATDGVYDEMDYMSYLMMYDLFICDFGTLNSQDAVNTLRDANGYRQGGLGEGVTHISNWQAYNSFNPVFLPGASTDAESSYLGSGCGDIAMTNPSGLTSSSTLRIPVFHGIENIFGHIWQMVTGLHCISSSGGNSGKCYICDDPEKFSINANRDNQTEAQQEACGYVYEGDTPNAGAFMKTAQFGTHGSLLPKATGGSSATYFCDYYYTAGVSGGRWVLFGGSAGDGASAGLGFLNAGYAWSVALSVVGSRLCFYKKVSNNQ